MAKERKEAPKMTLHQKLAHIQRNLVVKKSEYNNFGKYNYRKNETILESLKPFLTDLDLTFTQDDDMVEIGGRVYVKATSRLHDGDAFIENTAFAREALTQKGMNDSQITGSTSSFARKYSAQGLFLLDDNRDPDVTNKHGKADQTEYNKQWKGYIDKIIGACEDEADLEKALLTLNSTDGANNFADYIEEKTSALMAKFNGDK